MTLQWAGPVLAVVTLTTIGLGHVMVRKVNYLYGTRPIPLVAGLGLLLLFFSLHTASNLASGVMGVLAVTVLWDAFELYRQEERIRRGHAPANPNRPVKPRRR